MPTASGIVSGWSTGTLVRINGQQPSDSVSIPLKNTSVIRSVSISLGGGDDFIDIRLEQASLRINQDLLLDIASGADCAVVNTFSTSTLVTDRDISIRGGAGDDALTLMAAEAGRNVSISTGIGQDVLTASNLRSARSLRLSNAEAVDLQNITATIQLALRGTPAADKLDLERVTATRLDIDLAADNDQVSLGDLNVRTFAANII